LKLDTIFFLLGAKKDYDKVNILSLELLNISGSYIRKNAYTNLIESGDIRFIDEFKAKQKIINLYEYYKWVDLFDETSVSLLKEDYYPYLRSNFDFVSGRTQDEEVYQSKLFRNLLGAYKRTNENRIRKYKDCIKEMDKFLNTEDEN